jgi:hypothetical protein
MVISETQYDKLLLEKESKYKKKDVYCNKHSNTMCQCEPLPPPSTIQEDNMQYSAVTRINPIFVATQHL